jgi:hypothetical protein
MHAEFLAYYEATGQVEWLNNFIPRLRVVEKIYCDNETVCFEVIPCQAVLANTLTLNILL